MFPNPSKLWLYLSCTLDRHVTDDEEAEIVRIVREMRTKKVVEDCPFCGAKAEDLDKSKCLGVYVHFNAANSEDKPWRHVSCLECGAGAKLETWNRRAK